MLLASYTMAGCVLRYKADADPFALTWIGSDLFDAFSTVVATMIRHVGAVLPSSTHSHDEVSLRARAQTTISLSRAEGVHLTPMFRDTSVASGLVSPRRQQHSPSVGSVLDRPITRLTASVPAQLAPLKLQQKSDFILIDEDDPNEEEDSSDDIVILKTSTSPPPLPSTPRLDFQTMKEQVGRTGEGSESMQYQGWLFKDDEGVQKYFVISNGSLTVQMVPTSDMGKEEIFYRDILHTDHAGGPLPRNTFLLLLENGKKMKLQALSADTFAAFVTILSKRCKEMKE